MDIVKESIDSVYDYVVIGSGLAALGASIALDEYSKTYCIVGRDFKYENLYPNGQLITSHLFGGASNFWHGVIPMAQFKDEKSKKLLQKFYKFTPLKGFENKLFIPRNPIKSKLYFNHEKTVVGDVCTVSKHKNGVAEIRLKDGKVLFCKRIIVACGVRSTFELLASSKLIKKENATIDDHVCGYVGLVSVKSLQSLLGVGIDISINKFGYLINSYLDEEVDVLYTFRPAHFEMKNETNQLRGGPVYGKGGKIKVIWNVIKSLKLGRLIEAFSLKSGIWFKPKIVSIHFQVVGRKIHKKVGNDWSVCNKHDDLLQRVGSSVKETGFPIADGFYEQPVYFGNHLFNLDVINIESDLWGVIDVVDASTEVNIGGYHHSFRQLIRAYEVIERNESV